ncbi:neutral/alkaline non-lysosomal ceramidase N-terminal domain-containing protein [Wukongibacter baidiensis]|uniref:neutral/alkaline non-lysosomal ceramidase N-terminal domain-containing protein n=1 Tax=Wukongibacter baidiensis TaxID=1723361 RepID=UPI003D7FB9AF
MRIGFSRHNITPQIPIYMAGYAERKGPAQGVNDTLYAKAIVLEDDNEKKIALIFLDLLYVTKAQVDIIRDKVNELTGIKRSHIIISSSHTHSGPLTYNYPLFGGYDSTYEEWLLKVIPGLVLQASNSTRECKLGWYQSEVYDIGANRRDQNEKSETYITVISFADLNNKPIAVLFNYNCHPTVLSCENLMISADFPGAAIKSLKRIYGNDVLFAFSNGACGDISTRFTRRNQSIDEKDRIGRILAAEVIKAIEKIQYEKQTNISLIEKHFKLSKREIPPKEQLDKEIEECKNKLQDIESSNSQHNEIRVMKTALQGYEILKMLKEYKDALEYEGIITAIGLGQGCIVTQPAELFSKLGKQIMKESPFPITMIMGYSNGVIGYLPDKDSYLQGGYESLSCRFKCGSGEELANMVLKLIEEL